MFAGLAAVAHWHRDQADAKKRVVVTRQMAYGLPSQAELLVQKSRGGTALNMAFIERLNGTFRERLASLIRKFRHAAHRIVALETAMHLIKCTYNFCFLHHEFSKTKHVGSPCTPSMAARLAWSLCELRALSHFISTGWAKQTHSVYQENL